MRDDNPDVNKTRWQLYLKPQMIDFTCEYLLHVFDYKYAQCNAFVTKSAVLGYFKTVNVTGPLIRGNSIYSFMYAITPNDFHHIHHHSYFYFFYSSFILFLLDLSRFLWEWLHCLLFVIVSTPNLSV